MTVPTCDTRSGCITCGDEGIPMRVLEVAGDGALCVDEAGTLHEVAIDLVGAVALGERVLVHAGVAIGTVA
jgi:hydrogenase maturation factor